MSFLTFENYLNMYKYKGIIVIVDFNNVILLRYFSFHITSFSLIFSTMSFQVTLPMVSPYSKP